MASRESGPQAPALGRPEPSPIESDIPMQGSRPPAPERPAEKSSNALWETAATKSTAPAAAIAAQPPTAPAPPAPTLAASSAPISGITSAPSPAPSSIQSSAYRSPASSIPPGPPRAVSGSPAPNGMPSHQPVLPQPVQQNDVSSKDITPTSGRWDQPAAHAGMASSIGHPPPPPTQPESTPSYRPQGSTVTTQPSSSSSYPGYPPQPRPAVQGAYGSQLPPVTSIPSNTNPRPSQRQEVDPIHPQAARHRLSGNIKPFTEEPTTRRDSSVASGASRSSFASPRRENAIPEKKFDSDVARLSDAVQTSLPDAIRQVIRDNWHRTLLGSDFHQAFIFLKMNVAIHHSVPTITKRSIKDFGASMVADCKEEIMNHFTAKMLDDVADRILAIASDELLDKCLATRLQTIEATPLINMLAKAERLGFEEADIEDASQPDKGMPPQPVVPQQPVMPPQQQQQQHSPPPAAGAWPPAGNSQHPNPPQAGPIQCTNCGRTFPAASALHHHTKKKVCQKPPYARNAYRFECEYCGQGFANYTGLQYHYAGKVCGDFGQQLATPVRGRGPGRPPNRPPSTPSNQGRLILTAAKTPPANGVRPTQSPAPTAPSATNTPSQPASNYKVPSSSSQPASGAATSNPQANLVTKPEGPYAHLSPVLIERLNEELRDAEEAFTVRFKEADAIEDPKARAAKHESLRNNFGTKQSMIRKKYGVRLRERRTNAEIAAERERMGIKRREKDISSAQATPQSTPGSGWTAANIPTPSSVDSPYAKRQRVDSNGTYAASQPAAAMSAEPIRKDESASAIPGSAPSAARPTSAPARPPAASQDARAQVEGSSSHARNVSEGSGVAGPIGGTTRQEPLSRSVSIGNLVDGGPVVSVDSESSDSSDDEDIPAVLPAHVRQSLTSAAKLGSAG